MEDANFIDFWFQQSSKFVLNYLLFSSIIYFVFYYLLKNLLLSRKLQQRKENWKLHFKEIIYSIITITIFGTFAVVIVFFLDSGTSLYSDINEYGLVYFGFTCIWMALIHDTFFYWLHRALHHPKLYKFVHKIHHNTINPSPWAAYSFHPIEALLQTMIIPILLLTIPIHKLAFLSYYMFSIFFVIYVHLGYEILPRRFHKTWIGRWINTSVAHNLHHEKFNGNYSLYFLIWDRLMGTLREDYDDAYSKLG